MRKFLPTRCTYETVEKSPQFAAYLENSGYKNQKIDLHKYTKLSATGFDKLIMIISLSQFRYTSAGDLLEEFKNTAKKVIIVEDILAKRRGRGSFLNRLMNYLCATNYYQASEIFTYTEFEELMLAHGYTCQRRTKRYAVGFWEAGEDDRN